MKHKRLLMLSTVLVFIMVCVVCVKELFSVKDITVQYSVTSNEVSEEVVSLLDEYYGKNIFSVDTNKIREEITANHYLKVVSVTKDYPNEIVIALTERTEKFYYVDSDAIYYFDEEYFVVRKSQELPESTSYLTQFIFENIDGEKCDADCQLKSVFEFPNNFNADADILANAVKEISSNVTKISFVITEEEGNYRIRLQMIEGVVIEIRKAGESLTEKIAKGVEFYNNLEELKKIGGIIYVQIDNNGEVAANHTFNV